MSIGLIAGLAAMPRIHFAADDPPGQDSSPQPRPAPAQSARTEEPSDDPGLEPLTSRAEILGNALHSIGLSAAGSSASWRFGRPRTLDFVPPSVEQPLGRIGTDNLGDTLSPMVARYLDGAGDSPVRPLGQTSSPAAWSGTPTEFVFARVRHRRLNDAPPVAQPTQQFGIQRTPAEPLSSGEPLSGAARQAMEPIIGTNLGEVRIHSSPAASAMASALASDAFTVGREVFFAEGKFDPFSPSGQALLAHELVHVRQQERSNERVQRHGDHPDAAEAEALVVERAVLDQAQGVGGQLEVGSFIRRYHTTTGQRVPEGDREQLDAISVQALSIAEQILGSTLSQSAGRVLDSVTVELELDLSALDPTTAAQQWGQAIASAVRRALG